MEYCKKCLLPVYDPNNTTHNLQVCQCPEHDILPNRGMIGWVCPNCKAGMSPFTDKCNCNMMKQFDIKYKGDSV